MTSVTAVESCGVSGNQRGGLVSAISCLISREPEAARSTDASLRPISAPSGPQRGGDPGRRRVRRLIQQRRLHGNLGGLGVGLRDADENAPRRDLHRVGHIEPNMAINAGTGVPAGIFLRRVINPDGEHVASTCLQGWREIDKKAREAVGMRSELLPVEIDLGVHVDALELDAHALAFPVCRSLPMVRYQPMPAGRKPPWPPIGALGSILPSMLQSCGKVTGRQSESAKSVVAASFGSPRKNFQSSSMRRCWRGVSAAE